MKLSVATIMEAGGLPPGSWASFMGPFVANLRGKEAPVRIEITFPFIFKYFIILSKLYLNDYKG